MKNDRDDNPVSEGPALDRTVWFGLAFASMVATVAIAAFVAFEVFKAASVDEMVKRAQAFAPFGAGLLALVTFFTVIWRGIISEEQLKRQAEQVQQQIRQNDAKDEEHLAKLLLDGTKLLGEDRQSHVLAGVAALKAVITAPNDRFSSQAMEILLDLVEEWFADSKREKVIRACRFALNEGAGLGRRGARVMRLIAPDEDFTWSAINGARITRYSGGIWTPNNYKDMNRITLHFLSECTIERCSILDVRRFGPGCMFDACKILVFSRDFLETATFYECDFTDAKWDEVDRLECLKDGVEVGWSLQGGGNFFSADKRPETHPFFNWDEVLKALY